MTIVTNAEELGKAVKAHRYPIRVKSGEMVACIESMRSLSRIVWLPVVGALGSVCVVFVGWQFGVLLATGAAGAIATAVATAGGGIALAFVGLDVTVSAVTIAKGGGGVGVLNEIRSRKWSTSSDTEGVLS